MTKKRLSRIFTKITQIPNKIKQKFKRKEREVGQTKYTEKIVLKNIHKNVKKGKIKNAPKKLILNTTNKIKNIKNSIVGKFKWMFSLIGQKINSEETKEIKNTIKFLIGYGIIGWSVLFTITTIINFEYNFHIIHIFGIGGVIYLFEDLFDYILSTIKEHRKK